MNKRSLGPTKLSLALVMALASLGCGDKKTKSGGIPGLPPGAAHVPKSARPPGSPPPAASGPKAPSKSGAAAPMGGNCAPLSFSSLVKKTDPAVVTVYSFVIKGQGADERDRQSGLGTGFFYTADGYILTNNHVIAKADRLSVRVEDEMVEAKLIGTDPLTDVAIVKVEAKNHAFLKLGDSDALEVGDWVMAIGNPYGLSHSVSVGIISARNRTSEDVRGLDHTGRAYFSFLQTDAAINHGNSGGPLISLKGEVIGINTAIHAKAKGIGFSIPSNMVASLVPKLVKDGKVKRSAMGIGVLKVSKRDMQRLGRPNRKGARVADVKPGGPADKAGLGKDDIIVSFDGKDVPDPNRLRWLASMAGVGKTVKVRVARGKREFDLSVTLGKLPSRP